jgi:septal ring factor EnvC (AmiA/AmiB activator)
MAKPKRKWIKRLTNKYRLVILNDENLEEVSSFRLSPINVYILFSTIFVILILFTVSIIVFTPLKQYVPGYTDQTIRRNYVQLKLRADSMQQVVQANSDYLKNLQNIINGNVSSPQQSDSVKVNSKLAEDTIELEQVGSAEKDMRAEVEGQTISNSSLNHSEQGALGNHTFSLPVQGFISRDYAPQKGEYGVELATTGNSPVRAILDGTVVFASYTASYGYVIAVQHNNYLLSLYKKTGTLMKQAGDFVRAGDVLAQTVSTKDNLSLSVVDFELWYNGVPLDPHDFLSF